MDFPRAGNHPREARNLNPGCVLAVQTYQSEKASAKTSKAFHSLTQEWLEAVLPMLPRGGSKPHTTPHHTIPHNLVLDGVVWSPTLHHELYTNTALIVSWCCYLFWLYDWHGFS